MVGPLGRPGAGRASPEQRAPRTQGDFSPDTVALGTLTVGTALPTEWVLLPSQEMGGQPGEASTSSLVT